MYTELRDDMRAVCLLFACSVIALSADAVARGRVPPPPPPPPPPPLFTPCGVAGLAAPVEGSRSPTCAAPGHTSLPDWRGALKKPLFSIPVVTWRMLTAGAGVQGQASCREAEWRRPHLCFMDANGTMARDTDLARAVGAPRTHWLVQLASPAIVFDGGLVLTSAPTELLDLSGGCCRPAPPVRLNTWVPTSGKQTRAAVLRDGLQRGRPPSLARAHGWLYVAVHWHASSFFHAIGEAIPRVMWGEALLRQQPQIQILVKCPIARRLLDVLGLGERVVCASSSFVVANRTTIPPGVAHGVHNGMNWGRHMKTLVRASTRMLRLYGRPSRSAARLGEGAGPAELETGEGAPDGPPSLPKVILVVRRDPARRTARALLNHDALVAALRRRFPRCAVVEFAPNASLAESIMQVRRDRGLLMISASFT